MQTLEKVDGMVVVVVEPARARLLSSLVDTGRAYKICCLNQLPKNVKWPVPTADNLGVSMFGVVPGHRK